MRATGSPNRSRRQPSVTLESGFGACSPCTHIISTRPAGAPPPAQVGPHHGGDVAKARGHVAQVRGQVDQQRPAHSPLGQGRDGPDGRAHNGGRPGQEEEDNVEQVTLALHLVGDPERALDVGALGGVRVVEAGPLHRLRAGRDHEPAAGRYAFGEEAADQVVVIAKGAPAGQLAQQ